MKEGKQLLGMILCEDMQNELSEAVIARLYIDGVFQRKP